MRWHYHVTIQHPACRRVRLAHYAWKVQRVKFVRCPCTFQNINRNVWFHFPCVIEQLVMMETCKSDKWAPRHTVSHLRGRFHSTLLSGAFKQHIFPQPAVVWHYLHQFPHYGRPCRACNAVPRYMLMASANAGLILWRTERSLFKLSYICCSWKCCLWGSLHMAVS